MSWVGIQVKNDDGRTGVVRRDIEGFMHRSLRIDVEGGGSDWVQLNANGQDSGVTGWAWNTGSGEWIALGDHNIATA